MDNPNKAVVAVVGDAWTAGDPPVRIPITFNGIDSPKMTGIGWANMIFKQVIIRRLK